MKKESRPKGLGKMRSAFRSSEKDFTRAGRHVLAAAISACIAVGAVNAEDAQKIMIPGIGYVSQSDAARIAERAKGVDRLNYLGVKGWNVPFSPTSSTILKDKWGFRSALAENGIGVFFTNSLSYSYNMLGTSHPNDPISYWGQKQSLTSTLQGVVTYDLSRHGVPDGQLVFGAAGVLSSWDNYQPARLSVHTLSWYQTLIDKKLELKLGFLPTNMEWIGTTIGGNTANPLGQSTSIQYTMGMAPMPAAQPALRLKWNFDDKTYLQVGAMRSLAINGPTGNVLLDDSKINSGGLRFNVPNGDALYMAEGGYLRKASPDGKHLWFRAGLMHNKSDFPNYATGGTNSGINAAYALADAQLTQPDGGSIFTAYRGLYAGLTYMKGSEENLPFHEQMELRAYYLAPFASRPLDMAALTITHTKASSYLTNAVNSYSAFSGIYAAEKNTVFNLLYTASLGDGVWGTLGIAYTDHPSLTYKKPQDDSLSLLANVYMRF